MLGESSTPARSPFIHTWRSIARSSPGRATPHPANEYAAWAKRIAEKYVEAQELEYGLKNTAIICPVNTFGPHDDFAPETALVVPALIGRALSGETPFTVWGGGSAVRDLPYVSDAVDGMLLAYEKGVGQGAFNIGSGPQRNPARRRTHPVPRATDAPGWRRTAPSPDPWPDRSFPCSPRLSQFQVRQRQPATQHSLRWKNAEPYNQALYRVGKSSSSCRAQTM